MSGVELIVGAVLGGIPVVLEAFDRYRSLYEALRTIKQYQKELVKLNLAIETQEILFRGDVFKVLDAITSQPEKCQQLLSKGRHDWQQLQFNDRCKKMPDMLRSTFKVWTLQLDAIEKSLTKVSSKLGGSSDTSKDTSSTRGVLSGIKLCLKESGVKDTIKELRDSIGDFRCLSGQILDYLRNLAPIPTQRAASRAKASYWNSLESYRRVRQASEQLYDVFSSRWACTGHRQHVASLALNSDFSAALGTDMAVKFKMSIGSPEATCNNGPLCLEVEYLDQVWQGMSGPAEVHSTPQSQVVPALNEAAQSCSRGIRKPTKLVKRPRDPNVSGSVPPKKTKFVRFLDEFHSDSEKVLESRRQAHETAAGGDAVMDFDKVKDHCQHFTFTGSCIEFMLSGGQCRFYCAEWQMSMQSVTLADIISWIAEDRQTRSFKNQNETTAFLGSTLACAILQYHSTPWLSSSWESSHVRFGGVSPSMLSTIDFRRTSPFFKAVVESPRSLARTNTGSRSQPTLQALPQEHSALSLNYRSRNEMLFRLGIVLLELGYSRRWETLRAMVICKTPFAHQTDYDIAVTLTRLNILQNRMGPGYPRIVRKCLGCDFGVGEDDMNSEELQGTFFVEVVSELHEIEKGLRELRLSYTTPV